MSKTLRGAAICLCLATLHFHSTIAHAQGTTLFSYQGRLNDANGLANGTYDIVYQTCIVPTGGFIGGLQTNLAVQVTNGLFYTTLDMGGIPTGIPLWLELGVRTNGAATFTTLTPRQQLLPTPFALFANTASNLSGTLPVAKLVGTLPAAQLPAAAVTNNAGGVTLSGSFTGNGAGVTNVDAASVNGLPAASFWQVGGNNVVFGDYFGSANDQPVELRVNNQQALRLEPNAAGKPNLIGGAGNTIGSGVIGATIGGGTANGPNGNYGVVGGGEANTAAANFATVGGGVQNWAIKVDATVGGGNNNIADGDGSVIAGGDSNHASGDTSTIAGGYRNKALTNGAVVGGGWFNQASNINATVAGGINNSASGQYSTVSGGSANKVASDYSTAGGGTLNQISTNSSYATIGGGYHNEATNAYATVPGGVQNLAGG